MTTEQDAVARAQERANATGVPWATPHESYYEPFGRHAGAHVWQMSCGRPPSCRRIDPAPAKGAAYCGRDWPEDFSDENGNYSNTCMYCGESFQGYKRRVVCKLCTPAHSKPPAPPAPLARDMTLRQYLAAHAPNWRDGMSIEGLSEEKKVEAIARWPWMWADAVLASEGLDYEEFPPAGAGAI